MPPEPDHEELVRNVSKLEELFEEMNTVVKSILSWKDKISGGLSVMVWGLGIIQSIVLICLGFAANALNHTAETLGSHAVELASTKAEFKTYMANANEKFTADANAAADATLKSDLQQWVRDEFEKMKK